jgi:type IV pilus assembly protein PilO
MQFGLRTLLFVVLLLVMMVLSYVLLFKPMNDQRDRMIADTKAKQQKLNDLAGALARTRDMSAEIKNLKMAIDFLTGKLPQETEMEKVLKDVWDAAKNNNLTVKSVRNGKVVEGSNYNEQPIRMVIEGPFNPGFFKFLAQVEQMPRLTKIKQMKIDDPKADHPDAKNNGWITADMELTIYYEPTQKVVVSQ